MFNELSVALHIVTKDEDPSIDHAQPRQHLVIEGDWNDHVPSRLAADFTGWEHDNAKFEREFEKLVRAWRTDEVHEVPPRSRL